MSDRIAVVGPADPRDLPHGFAHRHDIEVRFADTDAFSHVNNAVYLTYCETARLAYWWEVTGEPLEELVGQAESLILADASIAFRAPVFHGETVAVETRVVQLGRTSIVMEHRLTAAAPAASPAFAASAGPRLVATCRTVIVRYDYVHAAPVALDPDLVATLERFEGRSLRDARV